MRTLRTLMLCVHLSCAAAVSGCATQLTNTNTLEFASTVDDVLTRQIIFNLVKYHIDEESLPSQVQISGGSVVGKNSVTPQVAAPLSSLAIATSQIAKTATGTTTTDIVTRQSPNMGSTLSSSFEATQSWMIVPVLDPEQLRRLRLLYQYAVGFKSVEDLLCEYPVPEVVKHKDDHHGAHHMMRLREAAKPKKDPAKPKMHPSARKPLEEIYLRRGCRNFDVKDIDALKSAMRVNTIYTRLGVMPDKAFLSQPSCVICIVPGGRISKGYYFVSNHSRELVDIARESGKLHLEVAVNESLNPLREGQRCRKGGRSKESCIDWLFVVKDGEAPPRDNVKRVGGYGSYSVYILRNSDEPRRAQPEHRWAEFVLSIVEATLRGPQMGKSGPPAPIIMTVP